MGSATRSVLAGLGERIGKLGNKATLSTAEEIFAVARGVSSSRQLLTMLTDQAIEHKVKSELLSQLFPQLSAESAELAGELVSSNWSSPRDLVEGFEQLGIRIAAQHSDETLVEELYAFAEAVFSDPELELAIGNRLGTASEKEALVEALLKGKASGAALAVVRQLVTVPRGRRLGKMIDSAAETIAAQLGFVVGKVTSATRLAPAQLKALETEVARAVGAKQVKLIEQVVPDALGGVRVQVGQEIIDGTVAAKLADLRQKLVG